MKLGTFMMPSHPPERPVYDAVEWDLQHIRWADEYGYSVAFLGEHFTDPWEPLPSPDLIIAQALVQTKDIQLGTGGHVLPYHHPAELAHRVAQLDHMAQGRFIFGVAAGSSPTDFELFRVDGFHGENRYRFNEALEIILKIWESDEPFKYEGKYWSITWNPEWSYNNTHRMHMKPFQRPHPPIAIAGLTPGSPTLAQAGEHGFIPQSLNFNPKYLASHWDAVVEGAARTGRTPRRSDWQIVKEIFVAPTDAEAYRWSVDSHIGRWGREYNLPFIDLLGFKHLLKQSDDVPDDAIDVDYMSKNLWVIGSPDTVAEKLAAIYESAGGFGTLLQFNFDYSEDPEPWRQSMEMLAKEVMPKLVDLVPDDEPVLDLTGS